MRPRKTTTIALLAALAVGGGAYASDDSLRLRSNSIAQFESVTTLSGRDSEIQGTLEGMGYQPYRLQDDVVRWLGANRGTQERVYLAVPTAPPTLGWELDTDKAGSLCMRRPDGAAATAVDQVGFLVVDQSTPTWRSGQWQECPSKTGGGTQ